MGKKLFLVLSLFFQLIILFRIKNLIFTILPANRLNYISNIY